MQKSRLVIIPVLFVAFLLNCTYGTARMRISAHSLNKPVSLSSVVKSREGQAYRREYLDSIGTFRIALTHVSVSPFLSPPKKIDLSDSLNMLMNENKCDAIIDLQIIAGAPVKDIVTPAGTFLGCLSLGIFYPMELATEISGTLVRFKETKDQ